MNKKNIIITFCIAIAILFSSIGVLGVSEKSNANVNPGMADITFFGAKPDGTDCTEFIKQAANLGGVYIPEGEYVIKNSLNVSNVILMGAGSDKTTIIADFEDTSKPIFSFGRTVCATGMTIKYKDELVTGTETENQRVGVYTTGTGDYELQRGSEFNDFVIENVGTGIACGTQLVEGAEDGCFSVTFDGLVVRDFSYRGLDFRAGGRTGNYFKDVLIEGGEKSKAKNWHPQNAVYFVGEESETAIDTFVVKDIIAVSPIVFDGMRAISAKQFICDNVYALRGGIIDWESSTGHFDYLFFDYCENYFDTFPLIFVGTTQYILDHIQTLNSLEVDTLKINSMNLAKTNKIISRKQGENEAFYFTVNDYVVKNSDYTWDTFPADETFITITKKGKVLERGTTEERPTERLCPYYTRYFDTTLNKEVIWTGEEWK